MMTLPDGVNGSVHHRPLAIILPEDPSQEELAQYWTLSTQDKQEVFKCRGEAQRRRFAVQLCVLRTYGLILPKAVPARSTLEELVVSVTARVQGDVYARIATRLTPTLIQSMDELLQVPLGVRRSMLFQLKEYPAEASYSVILRYIEHYHFLRDFGVGSIDLGGISPPMIRYLADQVKLY